jgi:hypothetical protein
MRFGTEFLFFARDARMILFFLNPSSRIVPRHQAPLSATSRSAGIFKRKLQRPRFDAAVAKDHVGFAGEFIGNVNRHFSIIGCAIFEARRQKPYQPEN